MSFRIQPYHISQLSTLCARHPIDRKVVFVPSAQIGYNLGIALAEHGTSWINLYLTTPAHLAEDLVGPRLRARGWRPLVQDVDLFFVQRELRRLSPEELGSLSTEPPATGLARSILRTLRALRSAGVDPRRLGAAQLRHGGVLQRLYTAYCQWLEASRLYDRQHLYRAATELALPGAETVYAVFDETLLDAAAANFVKRISEGRIWRIGLPSAGGRSPKGSAGERFSDRPVVTGDGAIHPAAALLDHVTDKPQVSIGIRLREAVGEENEVRGVFRELLSEKVSWDRVEIAYTQEDVYLGRIVAATDQFGIPATFAEGIPVTSTFVGQALLTFFRWIGGGFDPELLVRMCRSRLLETRSVSPAVLARLIEDARIGAGRDSYSKRLEAYAEWQDARSWGQPDVDSRRAERQTQTIRRVQKLLDALYNLVPNRRSTTLSGLCAAGIAFMERFAPANRSPRDRRAVESLRERLVEIAECAQLTGPVDELSYTLADLLSAHKIEASVAKPGHLHVVPIDRSGYSGREHLVILGLAETSFPGTFAEDPLLLDDERETLSAELTRERTRSGEAVWHLERALGRAAGEVTLVSNRRSIADGREMYPSAAFQQIKDRLPDHAANLYLPVPDPANSLSEAELALAMRGADGLQERLEHDRSWLAHGSKAERERMDPSFGIFSGWIGRATPELRPGLSKPISASRLETLAACPYRYFLKYVLGIRPPEEHQEEAHRWLDAREFGSLLHEVFRVFMVEVTSRNERVDVERHAGLLDEIVDRTIQETLERIPARFETGFQADVNRIRRAARIFLNEESGRDVRPIGFEVSFGMGSDEGFDRPDPVLISLSENVQFALKGSIDRVDLAPDGYEIWDYKSGSTYDYDEQDLLMRGRRLQWALYAHAFAVISSEGDGATGVARAGYFFPNDREHGLRLSERPPGREELAARLEPLLDLASQGAFVHVQKTEACKFCDYHAVCAKERRTESDLEEVAIGPVDGASFMDSLVEWMNV